MKNKDNQIILIEKFLISKELTMIINQVNNEYGLFYLSVIKYYADKQGIKLNIDGNNETLGIEDDLFGLKEIKIFDTTNTKKLTTLSNLNNKNNIYRLQNYKKLIQNIIALMVISLNMI